MAAHRIDQAPPLEPHFELRFELRFESLFQAGRGLSFPCDAGGAVDINGLSERARNNYLFARALIGRAYAVPAVQSALVH